MNGEIKQQIKTYGGSMKEYEIIKCKKEQEVIELVSFFESVFF